MRTRTLLVTALVATAAVATVAQAAPAPPKNFTKTVAYTDATPDPTGNAGATNADHCTGKLPSQEKGITVKIPAKGFLNVTLSGFQGDWALQIKDTKGEVLSGDDVNPPDYEASGVSVKKATTVVIFPCNLAGTPNGKVTYTYTYKK